MDFRATVCFSPWVVFFQMSHACKIAPNFHFIPATLATGTIYNLYVQLTSLNKWAEGGGSQPDHTSVLLMQPLSLTTCTLYTVRVHVQSYTQYKMPVCSIHVYTCMYVYQDVQIALTSQIVRLSFSVRQLHVLRRLLRQLLIYYTCTVCILIHLSQDSINDYFMDVHIHVHVKGKSTIYHKYFRVPG